MIGHPDEDEVERWRTSDTAILRSDLHRALGRRMVRPDVDGESVASRRRSARPPRDSSAASVRPPDRDRAATRWSDATKESLPSDIDLIEAVRGGAVEAYGKLYARHLGAARNLARQLARSPIEADDLVSEAFARVLSSLCAGGGPDTAFRAYLLAALRHTAYDKTRRDRKLELAEDVEAVAGAAQVTAVPFDDTAVAKLDRSLAVTAFSALPERWQTVLWHTEIEGERPGDVAPLLGLNSNGVSALAYRAREGLRKAYLQAHVTRAPSERCRAAAGKLGSWTRDGLSRRETAQVEAHLDKCDVCRTLAAELADVNRALRATIAPIVLGAGTLGYLATAGKASAAVSIAATSASLAPPLISAAASTVAITVAVASGMTTPPPTIVPSAIGRPPASSIGATPTAPIATTAAPGSVSPSATAATAPPGTGTVTVTSQGPSGTASPTTGVPSLTSDAPGTFALTVGDSAAKLPITIRNSGSGPAPVVTLTLSLPEGFRVVAPGENLRGAPLLGLNGMVDRKATCPAGKGTVTCTSENALAPGDSVTFVVRLRAGPKSANGTIIATTTPEPPLRITIPVTVTPKS